MGTIRFLDDPPFELALAKPGKADPAKTNVWAVLPVFSLGPQRQVHEIHLRMTSGEARHLARALDHAAGLAESEVRGTSR